MSSEVQAKTQPGGVHPNLTVLSEFSGRIPMQMRVLSEEQKAKMAAARKRAIEAKKERLICQITPTVSILLDQFNYILKVNNHRSFYSDFEGVLRGLKDVARRFEWGAGRTSTLEDLVRAEGELRQLLACEWLPRLEAAVASAGDVRLLPDIEEVAG